MSTTGGIRALAMAFEELIARLAPILEKFRRQVLANQLHWLPKPVARFVAMHIPAWLLWRIPLGPEGVQWKDLFH